MALKQTQQFNAYGYVGGTASIFPEPIVQNRNPTPQDQAPIGQTWTNPTNNNYYALTSITSGSSNWQLLESSGGVGVFSSLTVTPGPSVLDGDVSLSANAVAATVLVGTGAGVKLVTVGSLTGASTTVVQAGSGNLNLETSNNEIAATTAGGPFIVSTSNGSISLLSGTGDIDISTDATANNVNLGTGAGSKIVAVGSTNSTSHTLIQSGSLGINMTTANGTFAVDTGTGAIDISGDSTNTTVDIAIGGGVKDTTIGSVFAGSTLTLQTPVTVPVVAANGINITAVGQGVILPTGIEVLAGAGDPNGVVTAPIGSLFLRSNPAGATSRAYINTDAGTTWTNITCAA